MLCPFVAVMTLDAISHLFEFVAVKCSDKLVVGYKFLNFTTTVNTLGFFGADNFGFNHFEYLSSFDTLLYHIESSLSRGYLKNSFILSIIKLMQKPKIAPTTKAHTKLINNIFNPPI